MKKKLSAAMRSPLLAVMLGIALAPPASAASATTGEVFDRYLEAVHAHDLMAVRALISPAVARSDFVGCRPEMDNPACLSHYIEATIIKPEARIKVLRRSEQGPVVDAELEVRSALYQQAGVERIRGRDVVKVHDGLIVDFHFIPDFADDATAVFFGKLGIGPRAQPVGAAR